MQLSRFDFETTDALMLLYGCFPSFTLVIYFRRLLDTFLAIRGHIIV